MNAPKIEAEEKLLALTSLFGEVVVMLIANGTLSLKQVETGFAEASTVFRSTGRHESADYIDAHLLLIQSSLP